MSIRSVVCFCLSLLFLGLAQGARAQTALPPGTVVPESQLTGPAFSYDPSTGRRTPLTAAPTTAPAAPIAAAAPRPPAAGPASPGPQAVASDSNAAVVWVQTRLKARGFDVPTDGVRDARTEQAIKAYQASAGLPKSGEIDQALVDRLAH